MYCNNLTVSDDSDIDRDSKYNILNESDLINEEEEVDCDDEIEGIGHECNHNFEEIM